MKFIKRALVAAAFATVLCGCGLTAPVLATLAVGAVGAVYEGYVQYEALSATPTPLATPTPTATPAG